MAYLVRVQSSSSTTCVVKLLRSGVLFDLNWSHHSSICGKCKFKTGVKSIGPDCCNLGKTHITTHTCSLRDMQDAHTCTHAPWLKSKHTWNQHAGMISHFILHCYCRGLWMHDHSQLNLLCAYTFPSQFLLDCWMTGAEILSERACHKTIHNTCWCWLYSTLEVCMMPLHSYQESNGSLCRQGCWLNLRSSCARGLEICLCAKYKKFWNPPQLSRRGILPCI